MTRVYDLVKQARLADCRIVDRQASQDGNTVRLRVSATGRNPITGQQGPFAGDVTMLRKSGGNWKIVAGS